MYDFIISALPWVIMGIAVAIAAAILPRRLNKQNKKHETAGCSDENDQHVEEGPESADKDEENYMTLGMTMGMCLGVALSTAFKINIAYGISFGMMIGMIVGVMVHQQK